MSLCNFSRALAARNQLQLVMETFSGRVIHIHIIEPLFYIFRALFAVMTQCLYME